MEKKETFTQQVKQEITKINYTFEEIKPLLSGFIKVNGVLSFKEKKKKLILRTENNGAAKLVYNALKKYFSANMSFTYSRKMKLNKNVVYYLNINDKVDDILIELELSDGVFSIYPKNLVLDKNLRFFIAGAFLASGSVNSPDSQNYHLQFSVSDSEDAKYFLKLLNRFHKENKMDFKILEYKNKHVLYLKKADQISTFLSLIGAQDNMYEFENARIEKDLLNSENRLNICAIANYQRMMKKSSMQIEDIKYLVEHNNLSLLPIKERALCELRLKYQEASLSQLSEMLLKEYNLVASKSGVNHLFDSIHERRLKLEKK